MRGIAALARRYGFKIIEDASHAIGGRYLDQPVGTCAWSDITVFSFHPVKIVTTAEGGLATTQNPALAQKMEMARSHGMTRQPELMEGESDGPWYYQQVSLGYNYRMTELQAALGVSQMESVDRFVARRHELARRYDQLLTGLSLTTPYQLPDAYSALHLYPVVLHDVSQRRRVFEGLREAGIGVNVHYIPVHLQPYYRSLGSQPGDCPQAEAYYAGAISLPLYYDLSPADQDTVVTVLRRLLAAA
jgi:dTDP-4-amino-4,6-dideoxygalactose transaminase